MILFKDSISPLKNSTGILVKKYISVQAAAELTGYNIQYLRRILRAGKLEGIKIGQIWLIEMKSLETYLKRIESTSDRRCGPRNLEVYTNVNGSCIQTYTGNEKEVQNECHDIGCWQ